MSCANEAEFATPHVEHAVYQREKLLGGGIPREAPVQLIADAIKDVSQRNGIVLDLFGGSGSTLIAAHKTGRRGCLCELDPIYCDRILGRWETLAGDDAELIFRDPSPAALSTFPPNEMG